MDRPHIITISGKPGSGKSSTSDRVAEMLGYSRYSSGSMVRDLIKERKMTLEEFNAEAESNHSLDHEVDEKLRDLRDVGDIVIDSRLGFYWIPESFKVYLDLNLDVATARIFKDRTDNVSRGVEDKPFSGVGEVQKQVRQRLQNEQRRFRSTYGVDPYDISHFDLVVDTSRHSPQTVALAVFDNYKKWLKTDEWEKVEEKVPMGYSYKNKY